MESLFSDGRVVDVILVLVALEACAVLGLRAATGRGPAPASFIANLLAGAFLLLASRGALAGASWMWMATSLAAALFAHILDLALRWDAASEREATARRPER